MFTSEAEQRQLVGGNALFNAQLEQQQRRMVAVVPVATELDQRRAALIAQAEAEIAPHLQAIDAIRAEYAAQLAALDQAEYALAGAELARAGKPIGRPY